MNKTNQSNTSGFVQTRGILGGSQVMNRCFKLLMIGGVAIAGAAMSASAAAPTTDNACAAAYTGGNYNGQDGDGAGGFGAWQVVPASNLGNSGAFIGSSAANGSGCNSGNIDCNTGGGPKSFGVYGNGGAEGRATRTFNGELVVGQTFTIDMDNGFIGGVYANNYVAELQLRNSSGQIRWGFHFRGGAGEYQMYDASNTSFERGTSGLGFTANGLRLVFTLTGANTYSVNIYSPATAGSPTRSFTGTLANSGGIDRVTVLKRDTNSGCNYDAFWNNMSISACPAGTPACTVTLTSGASSAGTQNTFSAPAGQSAYSWALSANSSGASISGSSSLQSVTVNNGTTAGSYTITATITSNGCVNSCSQTITVTDADVTPPTITCPPQYNAQCGLPAVATTIAQFQAQGGTATDDRPGALSIQHLGDTTVSGTGCIGSPLVINRVYRIYDAANNFSDCTQVIVLEDTQAPTVTCPAGSTFSCISSLPAANVNLVTASDNCGAVTVTHVGDSQSNPGSSCNNIITRTYRATDVCGNFTECVQIFTINDTTAPVLSGVPANTTVQCSAIPAAATVTATDNCGGSITVNFSETQTAGACPNSYTITRTWSATDACGNNVSASQTINVQDTVGPVLSGVPANTTAECGSVPAAATVTASDACDPSVAVTFSETSSGSCPTIITRTWSATDDCNNTTTASQTITVQDTTAPSFSAQPSNQTVCPGGTATFSATASDSCSGVTYAWQKTGSGWGGGWTLLTTSGNINQNGHFIGDSRSNGDGNDDNGDNDIGLDAWGLYANSGQTASALRPLGTLDSGETFGMDMDNGFINGTVGFGLRNASAANRFELYFVSGDTQYKVFDASGVTTIPVGFTSEGLRIRFTPVGANGYVLTVTRLFDGSSHTRIGTLASTGPITELRLFNFNAGPGTSFDAFYNYISVGCQTDNADNTPYQNGWQTGDNGGNGSLSNGGDISGADTATLTINNADAGDAGTYALCAMDACGNATLSTAVTLTVGDTTAPVITCPANATVECGSSTAPGITGTATATDNCSATTIAFTDGATSDGCGNSGSFTRTWTATDASGNSSSCAQIISIVDTTAPSVTAPANATVECGGDTSPAATGSASGSDTCGSVTISSSDSFSASCGSAGTITRTWTATDECGNTASAVQTISVVDTTAPSISVPANASVECSGDTSPAATGSATGSDTCGSVTVSSSEASVASECKTETITRT